MIRLIKHIFVFLLFLNICHAQEPLKKPQFLRINKDAEGKYISFDTLISTYTKEDIIVDLVGVVHVGELEYYKTLNDKFLQYDAVLYELIAEADVDITARKAANPDSLVTKLQHGFKDLLGLEFQLDHINYQKDNFVHADMTPEDFMKSMKDKNESIWSMLLKVFLNSKEISENNPGMSSEIVLLQMLLSPNKKMAIRKIMAAQFQDVDQILEVFEGPEGSTIISERNKVAINVLKNQIKDGKKKLAIFYGAGHMPHMEEVLTKELGFTKSSEKWLVAWKLN